MVDDRLSEADTHTTARVLAEAVRKIGAFDVVLCGEGSADLYFQQVGIQLGELLCLPTLNAISQMQPEGGRLVVERSLEEEIEVLEVPLPAVLSVTTDINPTRLPGMKQILMAAKKPVTVWSLSDLGLEEDLKPQTQALKTEAPPRVERKQVLIPGSPQEAAHSLVDYLGKEGLL